MNNLIYLNSNVVKTSNSTSLPDDIKGIKMLSLNIPIDSSVMKMDLPKNEISEYDDNDVLEWKLVTDLSTIENPDARFVICNLKSLDVDSTAYIAGGNGGASTSPYLTNETGYVIDDNTVIISSQAPVSEFIISKDNENYILSNANNISEQLWLKEKGLKISDTKLSGFTNLAILSSYTANIDGREVDVVKVSPSTSSSYFIEFNTSSPRFSVYKNTQSLAVLCYRELEYIPLENIYLDKDNIDIINEPYNNETLTVNVEPNNASIDNITWYIPDEYADIVDLVANDNTCRVVVKDSQISGSKTYVYCNVTDKRGIEKVCYCEVRLAAPNVPVTGVEIDKHSISINNVSGEVAELKATVFPLEATNTNVNFYVPQNLDNGCISIIQNGQSCTVRVNPGYAGNTLTGVQVKTEDGQYIDTCEITLINPTIYVDGVSLDKENITILNKVGEEERIVATVSPDNASNKDVEWSIKEGKPQVVLLEYTNNVCYIKPAPNIQGNIQTIVEVKTIDGSYTAECIVNLEQPHVDVEEIRLSSYNAVLTLDEDLFILQATVLPENATNKNVVWLIKDGEPQNIVSLSKNGLYCGLIPMNNIGTTIVECYSEENNELVQYCNVNVKENKIDVTRVSLNTKYKNISCEEGTFELTPTIYPTNATNKDVTWYVVDTKICSSDDGTGVITINGIGETDIYCSSSENDEIYDVCHVVVNSGVDTLSNDNCNIYIPLRNNISNETISSFYNIVINQPHLIAKGIQGFAIGTDYYINEALYKKLKYSGIIFNYGYNISDYVLPNIGDLSFDEEPISFDDTIIRNEISLAKAENKILNMQFEKNDILSLGATVCKLILEANEGMNINVFNRNENTIYKSVLNYFKNGGSDNATVLLGQILSSTVKSQININIKTDCSCSAQSSQNLQTTSCSSMYTNAMKDWVVKLFSNYLFYEDWFKIYVYDENDKEVSSSINISLINKLNELFDEFDKLDIQIPAKKSNNCACGNIEVDTRISNAINDFRYILNNYVVTDKIDCHRNDIKIKGTTFGTILPELNF